MATIAQLADAEVELVRITVPLPSGRQSWRRLYGTPNFTAWLAETLPTILTGSSQAPLTPNEQVYGLFVEFLVGDPLPEDRRFKPLNRTPDLYVWELKTHCIRIFGWFVEMDCFVCCFGDEVDLIKKFDRYGTYVAKVEYVRSRLNLDEPKMLKAKDYANVLSNADR